MSRLSIICHDGYNLFYNGKWTLLEYSDLQKAREIIEQLEPWSDERVEEFIRIAVLQKRLINGTDDVWNILNEVQDER